MKRRIVVSFFVLAYSYKTIGQQVSLNNSVVDYIKKSTPQASQFQKYGDVPVNANTGTVDVSIPFFKLGITNVDWSMGIGYQTGGIRVNDIASSPGLGWSLSGTGMISAKIFQRCDVFLKNRADSSDYRKSFTLTPTCNPCWNNMCQYNNINDIGVVRSILHDKEFEDTRFQLNNLPDIFYLNAGGLSAKFFLKNDTGYCMPSRDISIIHTPGAQANSNSYPGTWAVIDENGTKYKFEVKNGSGNATTSTPVYSEGSGGNPSYHNSYNPVFAITEIENVFGEKINFHYTTECYTYRNNDQDQYRDYTSTPPTECSNSGDGFFTPAHKELYSEVCDARLDSITTTNGQVIYFKYSSRSDLTGASKLDTVILYSRTFYNSQTATTTFIKSFLLAHSYWGSGSDPRNFRLRLDSLMETDGNNAINGKYNFYYNSDTLPSRISAAQDSAGYYNGQTNNSNLVPVYGGNRSFSLTYTKACTLEKVKYPTGGFTLLEYEMKNYGGLRIKRIKDSLDATTVNLREFEYASPYMVGDVQNLVFSKDINESQFVCHGTSNPKDEIICPYTATYSEPIMTLSDSYYGERVERYQMVTEYHGTNGINGKTVYGYLLPSQVLQQGMIGQTELYGGRSVYRKNGSGYDLIFSESTGYVTYNATTSMYENSSYGREARSWGLDFDVDREEFETSNGDCGSGGGTSKCYPGIYSQISIRLVSTPVVSSGMTTYSYTNDTLITSKQNKYAFEKRLAPSKIYSNDSKGNIRVEVMQYPTDFTGITDLDTISGGIKNLLDKHILAPVIENSVYLKNSDSSNTRLVSSVFTSYRKDMPVPYRLYAIPVTTPLTDFVPASVSSTTINDSRYEKRILFNKYDAKGNLLEQQKMNDIKLSYLWDHNYTLPVAQAINADSSSIAYSSFEADTKGGWTYSGSVNSSYYMTGSKSYSMGGGNITKTSLSNTTYIISYWGRSGSVNVNSAGPTKTGKTIGSWTYYEHEITGTSVTVSGSNTIDELRLYPKGSQMMTYTFSPLVGMTSQCDATNKILYYEYDNFNRLKTVKDEDGNIVKRIDYKYQGAYQD
ncbi:MAG TPA: hypothetical protein VN451_00575 [Chitinophagaceae bacterium]|nr:hypothetical protein [Chitinophagaceae bacterium]